MLRDFLKGVLGDKTNAILAGAAFDFKKALNEIKAFAFFISIFYSISTTKKIKF
jgi:hypothetical protein